MLNKYNNPLSCVQNVRNVLVKLCRSRVSAVSGWNLLKTLRNEGSLESRDPTGSLN